MSEFSSQLRSIVDEAVFRLPDALATLVVGLIVVEILLIGFYNVLRLTGMKTGLRKVLKSLARSFLFIVLFIAVLQALGLNNVFVALTGSSVILALLLSTGVAPLVTDILAGLFLGSDREFQPGATVRAGDKDAEGVIETMSIRKTFIRDKAGTIHVIPNSLIEKNEWVILKKRGDSTNRARRRKLK